MTTTTLTAKIDRYRELNTEIVELHASTGIPAVELLARDGYDATRARWGELAHEQGMLGAELMDYPELVQALGREYHALRSGTDDPAARLIVETYRS
jgi:hypothetical protein